MLCYLFHHTRILLSVFAAVCLLEVLGLSVAIADSARQVINLSGSDWLIHEDGNGTGAADNLHSEALAGNGWIPSCVPGNIQTDIEASHLLSPVFYGAGDPHLVDIARKDWWYRKDFTIPVSFANRRVRLVFDGVDFTCDIWLNGRQVGSNSGMFRKFRVDVTDAIKPGKINKLAVRIARMPEELLPDIQGKIYFIDGINNTRRVLKDLKSVTNYAYDWGINVWTLGIWKDVRLEATGPASVDWVKVDTILTDKYRKATVKAKLEINSTFAMKVKANFFINGQDAHVAKSVQAELKPGENSIQTDLVLDNPALWWPNGYGAHPLYELETELVDAASNASLDAANTKFGVREIAWKQLDMLPTDYVDPYCLFVNGKPVRTMGSNIIPPDMFFGRINDRGLRLLRLASQSHMTMMRLWGGGVILPEEMYDLADELGIMFSQEFPFANCQTPETDNTFLENVNKTARNIIRQVHNHPCIVEWTGGNEMYWHSHPVLSILEKAVSEDDGRLFRTSDPTPGSGPHGPYSFLFKPDSGAGWMTAYSYYDKGFYRYFNERNQCRVGEFGIQTPANLEEWYRDIPPSSQWPIKMSDPVLTRKHAINTLGGAAWMFLDNIEYAFGPMNSIETTIEAGQFLGGEGLRYAMDAMRRKGKCLSGFASWDYNEPWPNAAGSYMIDYDGRPLMNYDFVCQALVPVSLSLQHDSMFYDPKAGFAIEPWLVSDAPEPVSGLIWQWLARDRRGRVFAKGNGVASIAPQETRKLDVVKLIPPEEIAFGPIFVEMKLADSSGKIISERIHIFGDGSIKYPLRGLLWNNEPDKNDDVEDIAQIDKLDSSGNKSEAFYRPVRRTTLDVKPSAMRIEDSQEILEFTVHNTGEMIALFGEFHPLINYRTDLFIKNNHFFIPPGESRIIEVRANRDSSSGLTLSQTGWKLTCWNADDVVIQPDDGVILSLGRKDSMCREFQGYNNPSNIDSSNTVELHGNRPNPSALPFLQKGAAVRFVFDVSKEQARFPFRLRIHTSDQSMNIAADVRISINGKSRHAVLKKGLAIQNADPAHLAFPATIAFDLPKGTLKSGRNILEINVTNGGWFTWDAMDMTVVPEQ